MDKVVCDLKALNRLMIILCESDDFVLHGCVLLCNYAIL